MRLHGKEVINCSMFDYFKPDLEIVDYLDIPEWDNNESVFIPLFYGDIITR